MGRNPANPDKYDDSALRDLLGEVPPEDWLEMGPMFPAPPDLNGGRWIPCSVCGDPVSADEIPDIGPTTCSLQCLKAARAEAMG